MKRPVANPLVLLSKISMACLTCFMRSSHAKYPSRFLPALKTIRTLLDISISNGTLPKNTLTHHHLVACPILKSESLKSSMMAPLLCVQVLPCHCCDSIVSSGGHLRRMLTHHG